MKKFVGFCVLLMMVAGVAHSTEPTPLWSLTEEDASIFTQQDWHYTEGWRIARLADPITDSFWAQLLEGFGSVPKTLGAGSTVAEHYQWPIIGHSIFNPQNKNISVPDPRDRPYAGWLYLGAGLALTAASGRTDRVELLLGVVGPTALGREVQNGFHALAGFGKSRGWDFQLYDEPALLAQYQTIWDRSLHRFGYIETDALPEVGVTVGNVLTYGEAGGWLRLGHGLAAGGTPQTNTPGLSGTGGLDRTKLEGIFGWMLFGGMQTRAVWRNLFLEGNSYHDSPGVEKRNFVTDEMVGLGLLFRFGLRIDISYIKRGREFSGQVNDDRFGSITLSSRF